MKNRRLVRRLTVVAISALAAYGTLATVASSGRTISKTVVYVSPVAAQPGQQDIFWAMRQAAKSIGWKAQQIDANLSPDKQVAGVDTAITEKAAAIASWSLDPHSVAGAYHKARAAGIPVVGVNSPGGDVNTNVLWQGSLCRPGGQQERTAEYVAKLKPHAKIAVISGPPGATPPRVLSCELKYLRAAGLNIIANTANQQDSSDSASRIAADLLTAHPDIDALLCYNDSTALGAAAAVEAAHLHAASAKNPANGIIITGGNADKDALQAIKQGRMTATWDPNNIATGYALIYQMKQLLAGKKAPDITIPALLIDSTNVAAQSNPRGRRYTVSNFPGLRK
jgi:ribose transport system substrate-binding protein